jgi:hypothetical protein
VPGLEIVNYLAGGTAATLLAVAVVAFLNEWIYTRGRYREMKNDRDMWRRIALRGKGLLTKADEMLDTESGE